MIHSHLEIIVYVLTGMCLQSLAYAVQDAAFRVDWRSKLFTAMVVAAIVTAIMVLL